MKAQSFYTEGGKLISKVAEVEYRGNILVIDTDEKSYPFKLNTKDNRKYECIMPKVNNYLMIVNENVLLGEYEEYDDANKQFYSGLWKIEIENV